MGESDCLKGGSAGRCGLERTDEPHAAVALTVAPDGGRATLEHRGSAELHLDLGGLKVSARRRGGDKDSTTAVSVVQPPNAAEVVAGPGWRLELPVSVTPELAADERIVAEADFIAYEHDRQVAVHLVASSREESGRESP